MAIGYALCKLFFLFLEKILLHFLAIILFFVYRYRSVIGIGRYEKYYIGILSVSADMKIGFIGEYRYRQIWKKPYRSYTESAIKVVYVIPKENSTPILFYKHRL